MQMEQNLKFKKRLEEFSHECSYFYAETTVHFK